MGVLVEIKIVSYTIGGFISIGAIATVLLFSHEKLIKKLSTLIKAIIFLLTIGLWVAFGYWALGEYHQQEKQSFEAPVVAKPEQLKQPTAEEIASEVAKKLPPQAEQKAYKQKETTFKKNLIAKLPLTQPELQPLKESQHDVALKFVYSKSPALMIINLSDTVTSNIKWAVELWNLDLPDRNDPLPIPVQTFDWIKGHGTGGPQGLFNTPLVSPLLKDGDRLIGSASVNCPECPRGRTYIVYIVWGEGGWFSEVENYGGALMIPKDFSRRMREAYSKELQAMVPVEKRVPIQELFQ